MRKFKNVLIFFCALILVSLLIGVPILVWEIRWPPGPYPLLRDKSEIVDIKIIQIEPFEELGLFNGGQDLNSSTSTYTVLAEIEDIDNFIEEFHGIDFRRLFGDPTDLWGETIAIRISYNNCEIEYISYYAQNMIVRAEINETSNYDWWTGFYECDKDEFQNFLNKYL